MKITVRNIGIIKNADVEINGITVIAGENNTGKSTVGKALYAVFNSYYNINEQIIAERILSIENILDYNMFNKQRFVADTSEIAKTLVNNKDDEKFNINEYLYESFINEVYNSENDEDEIEQLIENITDVVNVDDNDAFIRVLQKHINAEFKTDINNKLVGSSGIIKLSIKHDDMLVTINSNTVQTAERVGNLRTKVIYLDDPYILDENLLLINLRRNNTFDHRNEARDSLLRQNRKNLFQEIVDDKRLNDIYDMVNTVFDGQIIRNGSNISVTIGQHKVDVNNVSSGLKTFVIIKTLLQNGILENNGSIILDEPEVHLHPEWQVLFAELIVLIQKQFNMHILINTHSPYFLNAIEVFAAKHNVDSKCKYYIAKREKDGSIIEDVTENVEAIYNQLARPFQFLENERWTFDD